MSELIKIVGFLENKVEKLITTLEQQKKMNYQIEEKLAISLKKQKELSASANKWEEKYNSLKHATLIAGGNENKKETKLKINALIRDIDQCIAQLSE